METLFCYFADIAFDALTTQANSCDDTHARLFIDAETGGQTDGQTTKMFFFYGLTNRDAYYFFIVFFFSISVRVHRSRLE